MHSSNNPRHSIYEEMRQVHNTMLAKYNLTKEAMPDIARAKIMTKYLRAFKQIGNKDGNHASPIQIPMEAEAIDEITKMVGEALGIGKQGGYSLFRMRHDWYLHKQKEWGVDDVFEAELNQLLNHALDKATGGLGIGGSGASVVGNLSANISQEFMSSLGPYFSQKTQSETSESDVITKPEFRSGKVDVTSFTGEITSNVHPQWQEFVQVFKGARFTVKNYSSTSQTETIHLGNTNIAKSLLGSLDELNIAQDAAIHIFFHSLAYAKRGNSLVGQHILHLRFAYELAGGGLRDSNNNRLDSADFFIYNDPASDNIYVRSTKEMIANAMNYMSNVKDPLRSNIVILKNSF